MPTFAQYLRRRVEAGFRKLVVPRLNLPMAWPLGDGIPPQISINAQPQSLLFRKLSIELRIIVYQAVLGDLARYTHIFQLLDGSGLIGHVRCYDVQSLFPTWQHKCFGYRREGQLTVLKLVPRSEDKLLALLLTCRLV